MVGAAVRRFDLLAKGAPQFLDQSIVP